MIKSFRTDLDQHAAHTYLACNLQHRTLSVHADAGLSHSQSVDLECCVVFLDFAYVVVLGNGETTVCWNNVECCAHLQRVSGLVLDEISVPGCNDDGVVPLVRENSSWCTQWSLHAPTSSSDSEMGIQFEWWW